MVLVDGARARVGIIRRCRRQRGRRRASGASCDRSSTMFLNKCRVDSIPATFPPAVDDGKMANVVARPSSREPRDDACCWQQRWGGEVITSRIGGLIQVASFGHHTLQEIASGEDTLRRLVSPPPRLRRHRSQTIVFHGVPDRGLGSDRPPPEPGAILSSLINWPPCLAPSAVALDAIPVRAFS